MASYYKSQANNYHLPSDSSLLISLYSSHQYDKLLQTALDQLSETNVLKHHNSELQKENVELQQKISQLQNEKESSVLNSLEKIKNNIELLQHGNKEAPIKQATSPFLFLQKVNKNTKEEVTSGIKPTRSASF